MKKKMLLPIIIVSVLFFIVWGAGLTWFAKTINLPLTISNEHTDAIIVLTGGTQRINVAINLLQKNMADKLFVSGVHKQVSLKTLTKDVPNLSPEILKNIDLGYQACNTNQNALESKSWIEKNNIKSIRLVTSSYHIYRSLLEFKAILPNLKIIPNPIYPNSGKQNQWWKKSGSFWLINSEFLKSMAVTLQHKFSFFAFLSYFNKECF